MARCYICALWKVLLILLSCIAFVCNCFEVTLTNQEGESIHVCMKSEQQRYPVHWVSEKKSVLLIGHGSLNSPSTFDCSVVIGAATTQPRMLQLRFEAFYITDCGVSLTVNQSYISDFSIDQSTMLRLSCGHGQVGTLHAKERHFVKVNVHRTKDQPFGRFNFRINITAVDTLPVTGLETHYLIIIGVVVFVIVGVALYLLVKYLIRRSERWKEHRRERVMERAIRLYNNQEALPESDYMYTAVPYHDVGNAANGHGHVHPGGGRTGRRRSGDIAFVHADGHIETFRMRDSQHDRPAGGATNTPSSSHRDAGDGDMGVLVIQKGVGLVNRNPAGGERGTGMGGGASRVQQGAAGAEGDTGAIPPSSQILDDLGEMPPSYEEAITMPTPHDSESPLYANVETGTSCKNTDSDCKT